MLKHIFLFIFIFCCLFVLREVLKFVIAIIRGKKDITTARLIGFGLSLSYILTIIFLGFPL